MSDIKFFKVTSLPATLEANSVYAVKTSESLFALKITNADGSVAFDVDSNGAVDSVPTDGSGNAVSSNGVFDALALKSDTSHDHAGVYEPVDATILRDADIGISMQAYDANTTIAGNTFNGNSELVRTTAEGKLPALDGTLLTGLNTILIDDGNDGAATTYSGYKTQQLHDAQAVLITNLAGASGSFYNDTTQPIPESPSAFADLTWTNNAPSTNADIFELGTNSFLIKYNGTYNFFSTLTFYRISSGDTVNVTFELYNSATDAVVATFVQPIDMTAGTKITIPMNALLVISGLAEFETVDIKVRMQADSVSGTIELFNFNSILAIASVAGGGGGVTDHGALTGLADDDHTQYHNDARGDARYSLLAHNHTGVYQPAGSYLTSETDPVFVASAAHDITAGHITVLGNTSGTNTGDETDATIKSKLGITTLSGSNTGDQTSVSGNAGTATALATARNINGVPFDGTANITVADATKLPLSGGTMTGAVTALRETKIAMGASNAIDLATGNLFTKIISGTTTLTVSGVLTSPAVNEFTLVLTNGGSAAITWFGTIKWASGTAPVLTASGVDWLAFVSHDSGTTWSNTGIRKDVR